MAIVQPTEGDHTVIITNLLLYLAILTNLIPMFEVEAVMG